MQKTVVRNPNQSPIRRNLLNIAGIVVQGETIAPQNGDRLLGGYGVAWLNNQDAASQTTGQDNPLPECNCESGGGGGGGSGGGGGVQPSGNCEKKNISELKQILDDYASQTFCDKEFPDVQFSTFIGYDKPPSDSTAKEIELRMLCPADECSDDCDYNDYCYPEQFPFLLSWSEFYLNSSGILNSRTKSENLYTTLESAIAQYHAKTAEVSANFSSLLAAATSGKDCDLTITTQELGCGKFVNCCERVGKKLYYTPYNSQCAYGYSYDLTWTGWSFSCRQDTTQGGVSLTTYIIKPTDAACVNCC